MSEPLRNDTLGEQEVMKTQGVLTRNSCSENDNEQVANCGAPASEAQASPLATAFASWDLLPPQVIIRRVRHSGIL